MLAHELTHVVQQRSSSSPAEPKLQRQPNNVSPPPERTPAEAAAQALIVDDVVSELGPGQMKKSEFIAKLRAEVCKTAEEVLAKVDQTTEGCPYLDFWFDFYGKKDAQHIERAIRKFVPEASGATTAMDYIPSITARVRIGVETWARTGEITGVPEGVPIELPGTTSLASTEETTPATSGIQFKSRSGGARAARNPQAIQAQLGPGRPLEGSVKSRMESAFGTSFSHVRVHMDARASSLSSSFQARAFTVGEHIAFGSTEYRPGTLIGDALIAHELAHVLQQGNMSTNVSPAKESDTSYSGLEDDADLSAIGAIAHLWGGAKGMLRDLTKNTTPRLKSGLSLRRCPVVGGGVRIAGKSCIKQAGREAAKQTGKEVAKQTGKEAAKQTGKEAAKQTGKEAAKQTSEQTLQAALKPNTMRHIFGKAQHGLESLVKRLGSEEAVIRQAVQGLSRARASLPAAGQFETIVSIAGTNVTVRGAVVNGIPRISTMFVPP
ncbi:MAG: DUF4157 domain-containing protein [Acidobacteria bacterium]|nr:DUF4157 domain-containing protein [Acidobacteriota bacterium]